jgi:hypothetical protein
MEKIKTKTEKWVNKRVTHTYNLKNKKVGVEVYYQNNKIQTISYGAYDDGILWSNMLSDDMFEGLVTAIDKELADNILKAEKNTLKRILNNKKKMEGNLKDAIEKNNEDIKKYEERLSLLKKIEQGEHP